MNPAEPERNIAKRWQVLLQFASVAPNLRDKTLAKLMGVAPRTVRTYWQEMFDETDIRDRGLVLRMAEKEEWFSPPPPA